MPTHALDRWLTSGILTPDFTVYAIFGVDHRVDWDRADPARDLEFDPVLIIEIVRAQ